MKWGGEERPSFLSCDMAIYEETLNQVAETNKSKRLLESTGDNSKVAELNFNILNPIAFSIPVI